MWRNWPPFSPFRQCFLWPTVHRRVSREMSECGQVVITGALIFPLQVLKRSENNLHSPPVKVLWLHRRGLLMLSGNQVKTHKRETLPYCNLHELNQIQVRSAIAVIFYNIVHVWKIHLNNFHCIAKLFVFSFYRQTMVQSQLYSLYFSIKTPGWWQDEWQWKQDSQGTNLSTDGVIFHQKSVHSFLKALCIQMLNGTCSVCRWDVMRYAKAMVPDGPGRGLAFSEFCAQNVPVSLACADWPESQFGSV